ncbi:MAG TPA: endo-alpha-N-acetylgalactosaminidase family protein, partial [Flavisolibacter sp.]|nr:endo-alpha-N-acetylgalactosaminidase family protein [Flavisolibacter sp.]
MMKIFFLLFMLLSLSAFSQEKVAEGGYGDMLYPYVHEYDQMLTYKIVVDYCPSNAMPARTAAEVEDIMRRIDNLTRGIPKLVYLVGWQYRGHDTGYPSFGEVNKILKRQEDSSALEGLRWVMRQGPKYNTQVSLHVNFSDCYFDDNPLGPLYKERDIIVRSGDGTYRQGYNWCDHLAYRASNYRNWYQETFKKLQIDPLFKMIPELAASGSLHPDAWYSTDDPYYFISEAQDCEAMREMTAYVRRKYNVDLTTEFDRRRPANVDFVLFHPMLYHYGWDEETPPDPLKVPSYFQTGGDAETWSNLLPTVQTKFFGENPMMEDYINKDSKTIAGGLQAFVTHTLPWYFLNRQLRNTFDGYTATFTNDITTSYPGRQVIKIGNDLIQDGDDVFIPALWRSTKEIIAFSKTGYKSRSWKIPSDWDNIKKVDVYRITQEGVQPVKKNLVISSGRTIQLSLEADEGVSILPSGNDPLFNRPMPPSGKVTFTGFDDSTKGNWKKQYGHEGHIIIGEEKHEPGFVTIKYLNGSDRLWSTTTHDVQALETDSVSQRIAAARSAGTHEIIDIDFK